MGVILCDIHEASSMLHGCQHVSRYIKTKNGNEKGKKEPILKYVFISNYLMTARLLKQNFDCIYCNVCSKIYGFNGRDFSSVIHLISNFINIRKFAKDCGYICKSCVCLHFLNIPEYEEKTYKSNLNKKTYLE